jgi:hypothetical protein
MAIILTSDVEDMIAGDRATGVAAKVKQYQGNDKRPAAPRAIHEKGRPAELDDVMRKQSKTIKQTKSPCRSNCQSQRKSAGELASIRGVLLSRNAENAHHISLVSHVLSGAHMPGRSHHPRTASLLSRSRTT